MGTEIQQSKDQGLQKITKNQFLRDYKVPAIQKMCRNITTPEQVFDTDLPTLGCLKRTYGEDFTQAYIETWIVNICEFVNIGKNMTPAQICETASIIIDLYPYYKLADINLVFKRAKIGEYGQIYDRLDGQIILSWFSKYHRERCVEAEMLSISKADSMKERDTRINDREIRKINEIENFIRKKK